MKPPNLVHQRLVQLKSDLAVSCQHIAGLVRIGLSIKELWVGIKRGNPVEPTGIGDLGDRIQPRRRRTFDCQGT